jgi:hypothetical protein
MRPGLVTVGYRDRPFAQGLGIFWRMRGKVQPRATYPQFRVRMIAVCKTVGFARPSSDLEPAASAQTASS